MSTPSFTLIVAALLIVSPVALAQNGGTSDHQTLVFSNEEVFEIPDDSCPQFHRRIIEVDMSFEWTKLEVGVQIEHTWRGDLWLQLANPQGTRINLLVRPGTGSFGTDGKNLDALFSDDGPTGAFGGSDDHSIGSPPFQIEGRTEAGEPADVAADPISILAGEDPKGDWTIWTCDAKEGDSGSLLQWALIFSGAHVQVENSDLEARGFVLEPAFPNPFSASTEFSLYVQQTQSVRADVYDAVGRLVQSIDLGTVPATIEHSLALDAGELRSGVYIIRVLGETFSTSQRVMLVR